MRKRSQFEGSGSFTAQAPPRKKTDFGYCPPSQFPSSGGACANVPDPSKENTVPSNDNIFFQNGLTSSTTSQFSAAKSQFSSEKSQFRAGKSQFLSSGTSQFSQFVQKNTPHFGQANTPAMSSTASASGFGFSQFVQRNTRQPNCQFAQNSIPAVSSTAPAQSFLQNANSTGSGASNAASTVVSSNVNGISSSSSSGSSSAADSNATSATCLSSEYHVDTSKSILEMIGPIPLEELYDPSEEGYQNIKDLLANRVPWTSKQDVQLESLEPPEVEQIWNRNDIIDWLKSQKEFGFDMEWTPDWTGTFSGVALMQFAGIDNRVIMIRTQNVSACCPAFGDRTRKELPRVVADIFASGVIPKYVVGDCDERRIKQSFNVPRKNTKSFDNICNEYNHTTRRSLQAMESVRHYFGYIASQWKNKQVQCSKWGNDCKLTYFQRLYASLDAWYTLKIGRNLQREREERAKKNRAQRLADEQERNRLKLEKEQLEKVERENFESDGKQTEGGEMKLGSDTGYTKQDPVRPSRQFLVAK